MVSYHATYVCIYPTASRHILLMPDHFGKITELNLFYTDMCPNPVQAFVTGSAKPSMFTYFTQPHKNSCKILIVS